MKLTIQQILVVLTTLFTLTINILSNALPLNGLTTGEVSDSFQVYFVPAGYVFSIWGLIYIGMIAFTIYQALPAQRDNSRLQGVRGWFILSNLLPAAAARSGDGTCNGALGRRCPCQRLSGLDYCGYGRQCHLCVGLGELGTIRAKRCRLDGYHAGGRRLAGLGDESARERWRLSCRSIVGAGRYWRQIPQRRAGHYRYLDRFRCSGAGFRVGGYQSARWPPRHCVRSYAQ